ncbi:MAG TPA: AMP-binding protein [Candidatus Dormibacteraeota bacterium]|nr:AMP-binding protein [Candidatus Dormibacteraeota bacterium]
MSGDVIWRPGPELRSRSRLQRFLDANGLADVAALNARAAEDVEWFWRAAVEDVGIHFDRPFDRVVDLSQGKEWATWWRGGLMNIAASCIDRHLAGRGGDPAVIWEGEPGDTRTLTFAELDREVSRLAAGLRSLGVEEQDRIGLFLPMLPETAVALLACARIGAIVIPLFSGFGPEAIKSRLEDGGARVLLCADGFHRKGRVVPMKEVADQAVARCPTVEHVVVLRRVGREIPMQAGRDVDWTELVTGRPERVANVPLDPETPLMILYTSGTTGRPKGTLHVHGGFPIKAAQDMAHCFDLEAEDRLFWFSDIGWMMGPWLIYGTLALGAAAFLYEGAPDTPGPDRLWRMVEDHRLTVLGVAPTLVRGLMGAGEEPVRSHDRSSLRVLAGTGEPWNPDPFLWFFHVVGEGRLPIINYSGGTEASGGILSGNTLSPLRPCSFAGPSPGMAADVVDDEGRQVRGEVGELVIRQPWPGMTRGFWGDRERYVETYWSRFPGLWAHGDWACVAGDGLWYVLGRSDDTIKVAGKRLGPAEVESVLVAQPGVAEAAAVGVPDEMKGEAVVCFAVLRAGAESGPEKAEELRQAVGRALGRALQPKVVHLVPDLPRTRNAKILRRVIRSVYLDQNPGDLTSLENPTSLDQIRATRG